MPIFLVNLFLGWTLIGWVVALAWAHKKPDTAVIAAPTAEPTTPSGAIPQYDEKTCPYCAEAIKAAALKCKHCGSEL